MSALLPPATSQQSAGVFSLKILIVFWSVRTAHRKFTAANINDLGAGNIKNLLKTIGLL